MIEIGGGFELIIVVTLSTIGFSIDVELTGMLVGMATGTIHRHSGKLLCEFTIRNRFEMTIPASFFAVCTDEFEVGFIMVEINQIPTVFVVAVFASRLRIVFLADGWFVNISMAIDATKSDFPETPFCLLFVTGKTWCCKMGSL
jgi:hypothetical protein